MGWFDDLAKGEASREKRSLYDATLAWVAKAAGFALHKDDVATDLSFSSASQQGMSGSRLATKVI